MDDLALLHVLRIKGVATPSAVAVATGRDPDGVQAALHLAEGVGLLARRDRPPNTWALTAAGRDRHGRLLAEERAGLTSGTEPRQAYDAFVGLDEPFKQLCTTWQLSGRDRRLTTTLRSIHSAVVAALRPAIVALPRFAPYPVRLDAALARLRAGDDAALTRPLSESYHDVWMELHEDLLQTLAIPRGGGDSNEPGDGERPEK